MKFILSTLLGFILLCVGIGFLIDGLSSRKPVSIAVGGVAVLAVLIWFSRAIARSKRVQTAQVQEEAAKLAEGKRLCRFCNTDFDEATSRKTPEAGIHIAIGIVLASLVIVFGGVFIYVIRFSSYYSVMCVFIIAAGVGMLVQAIRGMSRVYIHCPKCERRCGWTYRGR